MRRRWRRASRGDCRTRAATRRSADGHPNAQSGRAGGYSEDRCARRPRIIILTTFDLDEYVFEALRGGASGFLLKDTTADELVRAVKLAVAGDALLASSVTRRLIERYANSAAAQPTQSLETLTGRELDVLVLVARGLSNTEVAEGCSWVRPRWKTHVSHVLDKLDLRDRVQAVVLAYESGLVERRLG